FSDRLRVADRKRKPRCHDAACAAPRDLWLFDASSLYLGAHSLHGVDNGRSSIWLPSRVVSGKIRKSHRDNLYLEAQMRKSASLIGIATVVFCIHAHTAIADEVPKFDIGKTCKTDVQAFQSNASGQASSTGCLKDEESARTTLVSQWTQ